LAAGLGKDINIYNINDGNLVSSLKGHTNWVNDLVQISDDLLASSSNDQTVRIWNLKTNTSKFILTGHNHFVRSLKQITSSILASGELKTIKLWDTSNGLEIRNLTGHVGGIYSLDLIDIGGQTLVSGGDDGTIRKWNWRTGNLSSTIDTGSSIWSLAVINLGEYFFSFLFHTYGQYLKKKGVSAL
jgi:WD40 repeat protein